MHISQYSKTDKTLVVGNLILMFKIFPTLDFGHACADLTLLSPLLTTMVFIYLLIHLKISPLQGFYLFIYYFTFYG